MQINEFWHLLWRPRVALWITLLVAVAALGTALIAQLGFGLKPCILCIYQRIPYSLLILGSLIALVFTRGLGLEARGSQQEPKSETRGPRSEALFLFFFVLLFLGSAGLAFFHTGVEQHWWALENGCKVQTLTAKDEAAALAEILSAPQAECDKVVWHILGFSVTVWNTALSLGMAVYLAIVLGWRKHG